MLSALYNIILFPLTQLLEFFYKLIYMSTDSEGIAVVGLSFVVTLCTLPLYMVAERWSEVERDLQVKMKPGLERIKKAFTGDERYMMTNTFYRQNHYSPILALRSSLSLLIQIPFFLAAYHFLSDLGSLKGYSFFFINDFGSPDATFHIGSFAINVLPIAMTIINCASGYLYSKGHPLKEKIQIYAFAAIFLVVLYNSPAGLVIYWTMNNILSLVKNIFYKLKHPKKVLYILLCVFATIFIIAPLTVLHARQKYRIAVVVFGIVLPFIPWAVIYLSRFFDRHFKSLESNKKLRLSLFLLSAVLLALLCGAGIPTQIIQSEPGNYCYVDSYTSPFHFVFTVFFQAIGFFIFWPGVFYGLFSVKIKKIFTVLFSLFAVCALINCFAFGGQYGPIYPELIFMQPQNFTPPIAQILLNALVLLLAVAGTAFLLVKFPKIFQSLCIIVIFSLSVLSVRNSVLIQKDFSDMPEPNYSHDLEPIFHLSKTGKNVIVIMQDRCFAPYIPYVFEELPDLREKFDGFHWYPNTVSMGTLTMIGTPGLFGGYDYTSFRINERANEQGDSEKTLQDKHNEALLTLPLLFAKNGWRAEVANLPYENYLEQPESNMYFANDDLTKQGIEVESRDDISEISYAVKYKGYKEILHNATLGTFSDYWLSQHNMQKDPYISTQIERNFIWFGFFKIVPPFLRQAVYQRDYWMAYNKWDDSARFVDNYSIVDYLPELTEIYEDECRGEQVNGSLILFDNEATHEPVLLQAPAYDYAKVVTNHGNSPLKMEPEFSTMCGIFSRYSEFFDYLKQNGAYDNTRIIIVSDHGMGDSTEASQILKGTPFPKTNFIATLLVKDFDSHGTFESARLTEENIQNGIFDLTFMTNADTPYLAAKDVIEPPIHPFTKKNLEVTNKNDYTMLNGAAPQGTRTRKDKKFGVKDDQWYYVKDNIFIKENWSKYEMNTGAEQ